MIKQIVPLQACIIDGDIRCHFLSVPGVADNLQDTVAVRVILLDNQQQPHAQGELKMVGADYEAFSKDKSHVWAFLKRELKGVDGTPLQFIEQ